MKLTVFIFFVLTIFPNLKLSNDENSTLAEIHHRTHLNMYICKE